MSDDISFEDTLAVMLSATQEVQNLLLWAGINGEVSRNQVRLLIREAKCIKRCAKTLTQEAR